MPRVPTAAAALRCLISRASRLSPQAPLEPLFPTHISPPRPTQSLFVQSQRTFLRPSADPASEEEERDPSPRPRPPLPCFWSSPEPTFGYPGGPPVPELLLSRTSCIRNGEVIFRELNLTVHEGGAVLLTGPNGSGKSSLLRLLAGFIRPSAGYYLWRGLDLTNSDAYDLFRTNVHLVANKDAIKDQLTVDENVRFWALTEGTVGRVPWALEQLGLRHLATEKASTLSLGQRKRLQISRLLAMPRSIWLLDEPTIGLDTQGIDFLEHAIEEHRQCGGLVLVATHAPVRLTDYMDLRFPSRQQI